MTSRSGRRSSARAGPPHALVPAWDRGSARRPAGWPVASLGTGRPAQAARTCSSCVGTSDRWLTPATIRATTSVASKRGWTSSGTRQRLARTTMARPATWKSGRQASQWSVGRGSRRAAQASALAAWLPWLSRAPRARPVVPEVKTIVAGASRSTTGSGRAAGALPARGRRARRHFQDLPAGLRPGHWRCPPRRRGRQPAPRSPRRGRAGPGAPPAAGRSARGRPRGG